MIDPAAALMVAGATIVLGGGRQWRELRRRERDLRKAVALTRSLRTSLVGLAMIGTAFGWWFDVPALLIVSLMIRADGLLETSVVAAALEAELRRRSGRPPAELADPLVAVARARSCAPAPGQRW